MGMPTRKQRDLAVAVTESYQVDSWARELRETPPPVPRRSKLVAVRCGRKSTTSTQFVAHVDFSEEGAFIVWTTGTAKRGNTWRARLPTEQLASWADTVRSMELANAKREHAKARLEAAAWKEAARQLSDYATLAAVRASINRVSRQKVKK
jgi:hypothetical protein